MHSKQRLQEENAAQARAKQQKLELVRTIINADSDSDVAAKGTSHSGPVTRGRLPPGPTPPSGLRGWRTSDSDMPDVTALTPFKIPPKTPAKPPFYGASNGPTVLRPLQKTRARSPPPIKPVNVL